MKAIILVEVDEITEVITSKPLKVYAVKEDADNLDKVFHAFVDLFRKILKRT